MSLSLENKTKKVILLPLLEKASNPFSRMKGLLGKSQISPEYGLLITSCNSIHSYFMKFPIDVIFIDRNDHVVDWVTHVQPWRLVLPRWKAKSVIECSAGKIDQWRTLGWIEKGDVLYVGH